MNDTPNSSAPLSRSEVHSDALSLLKEYEQWEADIILENGCWTGQNVQLTHELYERMIQLQTKRNAVLRGSAAQASTKPPFCTCPCSCDETPHDGSKCPLHDTVTDWEDVEQLTNVRAPAQAAPQSDIGHLKNYGENGYLNMTAGESYKMGFAAGVASSMSSAPAQAGRGTGWLVEWPPEEIYPMPARWWHPGHGWGTDASKAMRFARKCDAEAYIGTNVFTTDIRASEHVWASPVPLEQEKSHD